MKMVKKILAYFGSLCVAGFVIAFGVLNTNIVEFGFYPVEGRFSCPLFCVIYLSMFIGSVATFLLSWMLRLAGKK